MLGKLAKRVFPDMRSIFRSQKRLNIIEIVRAVLEISKNENPYRRTARDALCDFRPVATQANPAP